MPLYNYNTSNELTSTSNGSYAYDANGNTLTDSSGKQYSWDFENRLTQVVNPGVGTTTFRYDPFGRRIQKSGPLGTTNYLYDGAYLVEEVDNTGNVLGRYAQSSHETGGFLQDEPLSQLRSGTTSYYQADALSTITSLSNPAAALTDTYTYDSFGKLISSAGSTTNPYRYTGREFDQETGIYEYRARYFDQNIGRFVSEDPINFKAGLNFYRYVRNQPVNLSDPTGLYSLQGFSPQAAAQMSIAIGQLAAKLRQNPCCIDPKMRDRILDLLQPFGSGGTTFVYRQNLPSAGPNWVTCAQVGVWDFLTNKVEVSQAALDGTCPCSLAGTILHEMTHQTWKNFWNNSVAEPQAYGNAAACFGQACAMPQGLPNP